LARGPKPIKENKKLKKQPDQRMHSAEHILNQTMVRLYDCGRCFSAHLGSKKSKCDYHFNQSLTDEEISEIQSRVNAVIDADLPVTDSFVSMETAQRLYNTKRLPDAVTENVRIVHIGDYDACPCIGEHVSSTGEIGRFRITTMSFEDGVLRIRFKLSR
jgi:misacylated tRNA(Ala) deacylase